MPSFRLQPLILLMLVSVANGAPKPAPAIPNPSLAAREQGIDDEKHQRFLPIGDLKVDVRSN